MRKSACVRACMRACMRACVGIYSCVRVRMCLLGELLSACVRAYMRACMRACVGIYSCVRVRMYLQGELLNSEEVTGSNGGLVQNNCAVICGGMVMLNEE